MKHTTGPVYLWVMPTADGHRDTLLKGNLRDWLRDNHVSAMYSLPLRGWHIRNHRVPDVLATAHAQGVSMRMRGAAK